MSKMIMGHDWKPIMCDKRQHDRRRPRRQRPSLTTYTG